VADLASLAIREGNRKRPVYEMHKWWARRLACNFRMILISALERDSTAEEDLWESYYSRHSPSRLVVLDPFMGGGTTIVESLKLGLKPIGFDIDPVARFVSTCEVTKCDPSALRAQFNDIEAHVRPNIDAVYRTRTSEGNVADTISAFWVARVACQRCSGPIVLHPHHRLFDNPTSKTSVVFCAHCGKVAQMAGSRKTLLCDACGLATPINVGAVAHGRVTCVRCDAQFRLGQLFDGRSPPSYDLFAVETVDLAGRREFRSAQSEDRALYEKAARALRDQPDQATIPDDEIPTEFRSDLRPVSYGFRHYRELFNSRQLYALLLLANRIKELPGSSTKDLLTLAFSDALASNNMFCAYAFGYRKLTPLFGLHAYRFVHRPVEGHVWGTKFGRGSFRNCFEKVVRGKEFSSKPSELVTRRSRSSPTTVQTGETAESRVFRTFRAFERADRGVLFESGSSAKMRELPDASVDLVVTDPPYFDNLAYSEFSHFYSVWISRIQGNGFHEGSRSAMRDAVWSPGQPTSGAATEFESRMAAVLREVGRVAKAKAPLIMTYHHTKPEAWVALLRALTVGGFRVTAVHPLRSEGRSGFHSDEGSIKWDAIVFARNLGGPHSYAVADPIPAELALRRLKHELDTSGVPAGKVDLRSFAYALKSIDVCQRKGGMKRGLSEMVAEVGAFGRRLGTD